MQNVLKCDGRTKVLLLLLADYWWEWWVRITNPLSCTMRQHDGDYGDTAYVSWLFSVTHMSALRSFNHFQRSVDSHACAFWLMCTDHQHFASRSWRALVSFTMQWLVQSHCCWSAPGHCLGVSASLWVECWQFSHVTQCSADQFGVLGIDLSVVWSPHLQHDYKRRWCSRCNQTQRKQLEHNTYLYIYI